MGRGTFRRMRFHQLAFAAVVSLASMLASAAAQQTDPPILEYPQTTLKGFVSAEFNRNGADCHRICEERSGCAGFDHLSTTNMCRLFAAVSSGQSDFASSAGTRSRIAGYRDPSNLPRLEELETWHFAQFTGVDLYGGDLVPKGLEMYDVSMCASRCEMDNSCRAFTFNSEQNRCFLKTGYEYVQAVAGVSSGMYFRAKPSQATLTLNANWELLLLSDLPGNDLGESFAQSYNQCKQNCEASNLCSGFTWVTFTRPDRCFLKQGFSLYPVRSNKGMVSARKITRTVMPQFVRPVAARD
ncbi:PAN domain-containing protein [Sinorhizobium fredii]|uniref:PAN domain-containing protein n=1 Tax=Rhizobium fredii TaxID=380 RepID=UPI00339A71B6